jgi:hypothetical protein
MLEGRFGIVVSKATTAACNCLTTCAVVDNSWPCFENWCFKDYIYLRIYNIYHSLIPAMERKDKRMHPEDVGAGSSGGKR